MTTSRSSRAPAWYRGDITGLRAVAILPVVAFHAGVTAIPGGFIGVDVFYVISGFLISTLLIRELTTTGRLNIGSFWAKRLRRLAPALVLMILVTLPLAIVVLSPLLWQGVALDAGASLLYVSNLLYASASTDYFADALSQSPYLHTWSLGVEEQFYLFWPLIVILGALVAQYFRVRAVTVLRVVFLLTAVLSFGLSLTWTVDQPQDAFYQLPARAWEFAIAAFVATLPYDRWRRPSWVNTVITGVGMVGLGAGFLFITEQMPFPGIIAVLPVLATLLIIIGGTTPAVGSRGILSRLLDTAPLRWIGDVSYSWYLWHWPFIVLAVAAFGDGLHVKVPAALLSLVVAFLAFRSVENPIRFSVTLTSSLRRTFMAAGAVTAVGILVSGLFWAGGAALVEREPYATFARAGAVTESAKCPRDAETNIQVCELGDLSSKTVVIMFGDSHSGHWQSAMGEAAKAAKVRLLSRWKSSCPASGLAVVNMGGTAIKDCDTFQAQSVALVEHYKPRAVIVSQAAAYQGRIVSEIGEPLPDDKQKDAWRGGLEVLLDSLLTVTSRVATVVDNPRLPFDPNECASRIGRSASDCTVPRDVAFDPVRELTVESTAVAEARGISHVLDVTDLICSDTECMVADEHGMPIFRDYNHLSKAWTAAQVPMLTEWLKDLVH